MATRLPTAADSHVATQLPGGRGEGSGPVQRHQLDHVRHVVGTETDDLGPVRHFGGVDDGRRRSPVICTPITVVLDRPSLGRRTVVRWGRS